MSASDVMSGMSNVGSMAATGMTFGPVGAAVGGAIGIVSEFIKGGEAKKEAERQLALQKQREIEMASQTYYQKLAKGGVVKGPGTGTSDSVKTTLDEGSLVIPAKYRKLAMEIRNKYFPGNKTAEGGGDSPVAVSNGEVVFTKDEAAKLTALGIDLNNLID